MTNWKKQNESDAAKKPVMLTKDIVYQQGKLDRELVYIINKAKYYIPKPKPKHNTTGIQCYTFSLNFWKMFKYRVISGPYFPVFGLNTERYFVYLRIQSEYRKM